MNITMLRIKPLLKELRGIRTELERMNAIKELELAYQGLHLKPPIADTSGPEPETTYVNEERDFYRELAEELGKAGKQQDQE